MQVENKEGAERARAHTLNGTSVVLRLPPLERKAQIAGDGAGVGALPFARIYMMPTHLMPTHIMPTHLMPTHIMHTQDVMHTHTMHTHIMHTHHAPCDFASKPCVRCVYLYLFMCV